MYTNEERTRRYVRERRKDVLLIRSHNPPRPISETTFTFLYRARVSFEKRLFVQYHMN